MHITLVLNLILLLVSIVKEAVSAKQRRQFFVGQRKLRDMLLEAENYKVLMGRSKQLEPLSEKLNSQQRTSRGYGGCRDTNNGQRVNKHSASTWPVNCDQTFTIPKVYEVSKQLDVSGTKQHPSKCKLSKNKYFILSEIANENTFGNNENTKRISAVNDYMSPWKNSGRSNMDASNYARSTLTRSRYTNPFSKEPKTSGLNMNKDTLNHDPLINYLRNLQALEKNNDYCSRNCLNSEHKDLRYLKSLNVKKSGGNKHTKKYKKPFKKCWEKATSSESKTIGNIKEEKFINGGRIFHVDNRVIPWVLIKRTKVTKRSSRQEDFNHELRSQSKHRNPVMKKVGGIYKPTLRQRVYRNSLSTHNNNQNGVNLPTSAVMTKLAEKNQPLLDSKTRQSYQQLTGLKNSKITNDNPSKSSLGLRISKSTPEIGRFLTQLHTHARPEPMHPHFNKTYQGIPCLELKNKEPKQDTHYDYSELFREPWEHTMKNDVGPLEQYDQYDLSQPNKQHLGLHSNKKRFENRCVVNTRQAISLNEVKGESKNKLRKRRSKKKKTKEVEDKQDENKIIQPPPDLICENGSIGEEDEAKTGNDSTAILKAISKQLENALNDGLPSKEDFPCNLSGVWRSKLAGMKFNITKEKEEICVQLLPEVVNKTTNATTSKAKRKILDHDCEANIVSAATSGPFILTLTCHEEKKVAAFIGQGRRCRGKDLIVGVWTEARPARDCNDILTCCETKLDVWRRETLNLLREQTLKTENKTEGKRKNRGGKKQHKNNIRKKDSEKKKEDAELKNHKDEKNAEKKTETENKNNEEREANKRNPQKVEKNKNKRKGKATKKNDREENMENNDAEETETVDDSNDDAAEETETKDDTDETETNDDTQETD